EGGGDALEARPAQRHRGDDEREEADQERQHVGLADQPQLVLLQLLLQGIVALEHHPTARSAAGAASPAVSPNSARTSASGLPSPISTSARVISRASSCVATVRTWMSRASGW